MPKTRLILELDDRLYGAIVIVDIDGAHHLCSLQVADADHHLRDVVASYKLDDLCGCRELGVDLDS